MALNGVNLTAIAQKSLDALVPKLFPLKAFTLDFSDEIATKGAAVTTRVATAPTDADLSTGYFGNAVAGTTSAVTVTLSDFRGFVYKFTDAEWAKSSINLYDLFIKPGINAIAGGMLNRALNLVTVANFGAAVYTGPAVGFDEDKLADCGTALTDAYVPKDERSLICNTALYNALLKRDAVKLAYAYGGSEAIRQGYIPNLQGFRVIEYAALPSNSENLIGVACAPQGIAIAARSPGHPENFVGDIVEVKDPETGFTLQLRHWYSADNGCYCMSMVSLNGSSKAVTANLKRLVSA